MTNRDIAKQYFDGWNAHDADAIASAFADDGTYCDPTTGELSGAAIGANAQRLWSAFPNLSFELVSLTDAGVGRVVIEWIMRGTNTGEFHGQPATGLPISLPGVDVIEIAADGIRTIKGLLRHESRSGTIGVTSARTAVQGWPIFFWHRNWCAVRDEDETGCVWHHCDLERRLTDRGDSCADSNGGE